MKQALLPFNITVLSPTPEQLRTIRPVTSLDVFDGPGGNFHEDGLFSTLTFGRLGDPLRDRRFGYINLKLPVLHPVIYSRLIRLKGLYGDILAGTSYAVWNEETHDFDRSNELEGRTGYHFFLSHWHELKPAESNSPARNLRIALINKYRDKALMSSLLVLPAGLRDVQMDAHGRPEWDICNEYYQSVLMLVRNFPERTSDADVGIYDRTRYSLTLKILELYEHFEKTISGKKGFIQGRFASRRVFNGTRNVLSSSDTGVVDLDAPNRPKFNNTVIGLYQLSKSLLPKTVYGLKTGVVGEVFNSASNNVELVNPETLKREWVEISNEEMERWSTEEGLEKVINELSIISKRDKPVTVDNHYLALVYLDDQNNYRVLRGINELPKDKDSAFVRPITYIELIYLSALTEWNKNSGFVTRYPIENSNSSYPTKPYVKTTIVGELRYELDEEFNRRGNNFVALEYPVIKPGVVTQYHDSISVNPTKLAALGGDFDGDTVSWLSLYSNEAIKETDDYFKTRAAYVKAGGGLNFSVGIHTLQLVLSFMTR